MTKREFKTKVPKANMTELKKMGFCEWGKITHGFRLMLIPKKLFNSIPQGFKVVDIFGEQEKFDKNTSDNDHRYGSLGYGIPVSPNGDSLSKKVNHIKDLVKALKSDKAYREAWKANIAMAYMDNHQWYVDKLKKKSINTSDRHAIANNAADYFLKQLCGQLKTPKGH